MYVLFLTVGLAAGTLSGVIGFGSTIILVPFVAYQYGPKQAVPIMAISALMSNIGKVAAWWRDVFHDRYASDSARCSYAPGAIDGDHGNLTMAA